MAFEMDINQHFWNLNLPVSSFMFTAIHASFEKMQVQ